MLMMCCSGVILASKKTIVTVVHARMGSARFPGKMMELLGGYPVIEWVLRRSSGATGSDHIVLATSDLPQDGVLVEVAHRLGIQTFRGSHENVLQRVIDAGSELHADAVVRVCADNPFVAPEMIRDLIHSFRSHWVDYAFNHRPGLGLVVADGFGAEIFDIEVLSTLEAVFGEPRYREHLTSAFWEHQTQFSIRTVEAPIDLADSRLRFDVDTPQDLEYLNQLVRRGDLNFASSARTIVETARV